MAKADTKRNAANQMQFLRTHFAPGNVIFSSYWRTNDRVLEFRELIDGAWSVVVEQVQLKNGAWIAVGPRRCHATRPDKRDTVIQVHG